jgi:hypothetical protein
MYMYIHTYIHICIFIYVCMYRGPCAGASARERRQAAANALGYYEPAPSSQKSSICIWSFCIVNILGH